MVFVACEEVVELELKDADAPVVAAAELSDVGDAADFAMDDTSFVCVADTADDVEPVYETCQLRKYITELEHTTIPIVLPPQN